MSDGRGMTVHWIDSAGGYHFGKVTTRTVSARLSNTAHRSERGKDGLAPGSVVRFHWRGRGELAGQVWAQAPRPRYWWVADGAEFHEVHEEAMTVLQSTAQAELEEMSA